MSKDRKGAKAGDSGAADSPSGPNDAVVNDVSMLIAKERWPSSGPDMSGWTLKQLIEYKDRVRNSRRAKAWTRLQEILTAALHDSTVMGSAEARHLVYVINTALFTQDGLEFTAEDVLSTIGFNMVRQQGKKPTTAKTELYLQYAEQFGSNNKLAVEQMRCDAPKEDDGRSVFYWRGSKGHADLIERETGEPISAIKMKSQLQRVKAHHQKAEKTLG